jgi:hypothetical protein
MDPVDPKRENFYKYTDGSDGVSNSSKTQTTSPETNSHEMRWMHILDVNAHSDISDTLCTHLWSVSCHSLLWCNCTTRPGWGGCSACHDRTSSIILNSIAFSCRNLQWLRRHSCGGQHLGFVRLLSRRVFVQMREVCTAMYYAF